MGLDLSVEDLNQSWGTFSEAYSGDPGTYEVSDYYSFTRVKIYTPHEDERARVRISYTMNNVVNAWADTGRAVLEVCLRRLGRAV